MLREKRFMTLSIFIRLGNIINCLVMIILTNNYMINSPFRQESSYCLNLGGRLPNTLLQRILKGLNRVV